MARKTQRVRKLTKRAGRLERRAARGNERAAERLPGVQERLGSAVEALEQRVGKRQAAGQRTRGGERALGRAGGFLPPAAGAPNLAAAPVPGTLPPPRAPLPPAGTPGTMPTPPPLQPRQPGGGAAGAPGVGPPTFSEALAGAFGAGNPFGVGAANLGQTAGQLGAAGSPFQPLGLFGNPLETAEARAQHLLGQNLANIGAGFGGAGLGSSSRAALAKGAAIGEAATGLGDILAARGLQTRGEDLTRLLSAAGTAEALGQQERGRALQAILGGGQLEQGQQALNQQAIAQALGSLGNLANLGGLLSGIGAQEQMAPGVQQILQALGLFGRTAGETQFAGTGRAGILEG